MFLRKKLLHILYPTYHRFLVFVIRLPIIHFASLLSQYHKKKGGERLKWRNYKPSSVVGSYLSKPQVTKRYQAKSAIVGLLPCSSCYGLGLQALQLPATQVGSYPTVSPLPRLP
jgi:hypothetical protein